jgi:hypothetical protein
VSTTLHRPVGETNAWVARVDDPEPTLRLRWDKPQQIQQIRLFFDTDADHPMESVLWGHPDGPIPYCVRSYTISDDKGGVLWKESENHQTMRIIDFNEPKRTSLIGIRVHEVWGNAPAAIFGVHVYR